MALSTISKATLKPIISLTSGQPTNKNQPASKKTTTTTFANKNLENLSKCTLIGAKRIDIYSGKYCVVNEGERSQSDAYSKCKTLNARLPLPENQAEMTAFLKISPKNTWIGIRNSVKGRNL